MCVSPHLVSLLCKVGALCLSLLVRVVSMTEARAPDDVVRAGGEGGGDRGMFVYGHSTAELSSAQLSSALYPCVESGNDAMALVEEDKLCLPNSLLRHLAGGDDGIDPSRHDGLEGVEHESAVVARDLRWSQAQRCRREEQGHRRGLRMHHGGKGEGGGTSSEVTTV